MVLAPWVPSMLISALGIKSTVDKIYLSKKGTPVLTMTPCQNTKGSYPAKSERDYQ